MIRFILNNQIVETALPKGATVLDFVRYHKNLKGTKIGCREGDCGACTIIVGELNDEKIKYRTQTSCLMPLANARGKHIVTIEGINKPNDELTEVQNAMIENSGTQCGFCTVGFVMSLTNFCLDNTPKTVEGAVSAIDGNICRCTGYKSIERAAACLTQILNEKNGQSGVNFAIERGIIPDSFTDIANRLKTLASSDGNFQKKPAISGAAAHGTEDEYMSAQSKSRIVNYKPFLGGGTDLYVQNPEEMVYVPAENLFDNNELRFIEESKDFVEIGASVVVTDLLESSVFQNLFPKLYKHLKLISSTPIRNMATLAGNFVNASPIGDMTAWFLAFDASIIFNSSREIALKDFYLGYKTLAKAEDEFIAKIRFQKDFTHFNFEKVCKRTYLDIASVNSGISLKMSGDLIEHAHVSAGGVFATPLYLRKTSQFLQGKRVSGDVIDKAAEILQTEISPISDVRGSKEYKRLLLRQLFKAHFVELFDYLIK